MTDRKSYRKSHTSKCTADIHYTHIRSTFARVIMLLLLGPFYTIKIELNNGARQSAIPRGKLLEILCRNLKF